MSPATPSGRSAPASVNRPERPPPPAAQLVDERQLQLAMEEARRRGRQRDETYVLTIIISVYFIIGLSRT